MAATKFDHEPLLPPGRHYLDLQDVYAIGVEPFRNGARATREQLYLKAEGLIQRLLVLRVPCRVFIDGSFLTKKPEPDDIDLVVSIDEDVAEALGHMNATLH